MSNIIKRAAQMLAIGLSVSALVAGVAVFSTPAHAQAQDALCNGVISAGDSGQAGAGCNSEGFDQSGNGQGTVGGLISKILNIFSFVVGAVSVVMIIIGGFRYIISGGDSNSVTGAKNTIMYALVGLVIVIFAQVIVKFVIGNLTKQN